MITTALIAFREFFEAFLIVGIFLGISKKLGLRKEAEIALAALCGILISLVLAAGTYMLGENARGIITERNADALESYLLIFSGLFLAYVVFSLHRTLGRGRKEMIARAEQKFEERVFDVSLFLTIMFLVMREGFEIALFSASVSLFSTFVQNFLGLLMGLAVAATLGISTFFAFIRFPVGKVFKITEYLVIILGAALTQHGITKLFETHFSLSLSDFGSFHLGFLPSEDTIVGHLLQGLLGVDQGFSVARFAIMAVYVAVVYWLFLKQRISPKVVKPPAH
ncbi:MAG: FTR1 family protein [Patescibacteria group bacterium]